MTSKKTDKVEKKEKKVSAGKISKLKKDSKTISVNKNTTKSVSEKKSDHVIKTPSTVVKNPKSPKEGKKQQSKDVKVKGSKLDLLSSMKFFARGGRKASSAVADVFCLDKDSEQSKVYGGNMFLSVNKQSPEDYFKCSVANISKVLYPVKKFQELNEAIFPAIYVKTHGGGKNAQADSVALAIATALSKFSMDTRRLFKSLSMLTRNSKIVESKKAGLRKARKKEQFSKR